MAHGDRGGSRAVAGAVPRRHPARSVSAPAIAQSAQAAARRPLDRRRCRPRQDNRSRANSAGAATAAPHRLHGRWRTAIDDLAMAGRARSQIRTGLHDHRRERVAELRRLRGFGVNPRSTGSRFIVSHHLLTDETYVAGLRDLLSAFRPRALLILHEAHHAAPASGARYAIDSQFTKALRDLADRFEHRLFLTATPHNGHSNSFSALLEMLDRQRFTRGVPLRPRDLEAVVVRRLKADLRRIDPSAFPERVVKPIELAGLPESAPELALPRLLAAYGRQRAERISRLPPGQAAQAKLAF